MSTTSLLEFRGKYIKEALAKLNSISLAAATEHDLLVHGALLKTLDTVLVSGGMTADITESNIGYVGAAYDTVNQQWVRLGSATGYPVGQFPGTQISPIFSRLRRVALSDAGVVQQGISWLDFTKYDNGATVDRTGAQGQIMVEYKPAYFKVGMWGNWNYVLLSHLPLEGFTLFPLFTGLDAYYRGAYEASVVPADTKLSSIAIDPRDGTSPVFPITTRTGDWGHASLTTAATDSLAAARGTGWEQENLLSAIYERLLMIVGYASYNIPGIVGAGRINLSGGDWLNDSYIGRCGLGDVSSGYASAVQAGGSAGYLTDYAQVLGAENPWGNVWKRVQSLVSDHAVYYGGTDYASTAAWTRLTDALGSGISLPVTNGYAGKPHSGLGMVLPFDVSGASTAGMFDYFYQTTGLRVFLVGGSAGTGTNAGPFAWHANFSAADTCATVGGRLCFKKLAA